MSSFLQWKLAYVMNEFRWNLTAVVASDLKTSNILLDISACFR